MHFRHKNHLISGYLTLQEQIKDIRDTICGGIPPAGAHNSLTPLSKDTQNSVIAHLDRVNELFGQLAQKYVANELEKAINKKESASVTKMWASMQLRQLQEIISDMHPEVFEKKYGILESEEREYLKEIIDKILQELEEVQQFV